MCMGGEASSRVGMTGVAASLEEREREREGKGLLVVSRQQVS